MPRVRVTGWRNVLAAATLLAGCGATSSTESYSLEVVFSVPSLGEPRTAFGTLYVKGTVDDGVDLHFDTGTLTIEGASFQLACRSVAGKRSGGEIRLAPDQACRLVALPAAPGEASPIVRLRDGALRVGEGGRLEGKWTVEVARGGRVEPGELELRARPERIRVHGS